LFCRCARALIITPCSRRSARTLHTAQERDAKMRKRGGARVAAVVLCCPPRRRDIRRAMFARDILDLFARGATQRGASAVCALCRRSRRRAAFDAPRELMAIGSQRQVITRRRRQHTASNSSDYARRQIKQKALSQRAACSGAASHQPQQHVPRYADIDAVTYHAKMRRCRTCRHAAPSLFMIRKMSAPDARCDFMKHIVESAQRATSESAPGADKTRCT